MDVPENSHITDKSWDHPWTTDEMRAHRDDWSLAADAGLLKHLQEFSDNLTEKVQKTQKKLRSLSGELEEASVIIDNLTNASLVLANTQFIESRVREDDAEIERSGNTEEAKEDQDDPFKDDLIVCVSESIKQGLNIMDEKFQRIEILASDSEDEGLPTPSIVLKPKDPYENRPLPYVIGTDKWNSSSKVGLESSSSDSEAGDVDKDSAMKNENEARHSPGIPNNRRESLSRRSASSSSSSSSFSPSKFSDRNNRNNITKDYSSISSRTDKLEARSQDTFNSGSEIATPSVVQPRAENTSKGAPSFAEELAKRLGNVLPNSRPVKDNQEADQPSINRFKDDLFSPDGNSVFDTKTENLFDDGNNLFDEDVSSNLWKNKPYNPPITNIIPPSLDVPPPMTTEVIKPKSAFDDLCGDPDSEDSDHIFTSKNSSVPPIDGKRDDKDSRDNKFLNVATTENAANMATSTPETNDNGGLFGDGNDYEDDDVLFGESIKSRSRTTERSPEQARPANRTMPPGLSITQADILSSNLGSRLFQRLPRQASSDSSDTESSIQNSNSRANERIVQESDSSGISVRPNNTTSNNTFGLGLDFQPQSESTRLKSEEIYRERFPSDSLFEGRTRQPENTNSIENSSLRPHEQRIITETLDSAQDEDFDIDDVFEPPPLPKHNDSNKSKSEFTSNDDLFSNSSSETRSHKSFDPLAASESQYDAKITSARSGGLFDEDIDIFGSGEAPQIDIFGEAFKSSNFLPQDESVRPSSKIESETRDENDTFSRKTIDAKKSSLQPDNLEKSVFKTPSIFDDSEDDNDEDDLFGKNFLKSDTRKPVKIMLESDGDEIFTNKPSTTGLTALNETKKDFSSLLARENVANETTTKREAVKVDSDEATIERALPSYPSSGLFDNIEEKDFDDCLFTRDVAGEMKTSEKTEEENSNNEASKVSTNIEIEESSKETNVRDAGGEVSETKEKDSSGTTAKKNIETSPLKKDSSSEKLFEDEKDISSTDGGTISKSRNSPEIGGEITRRDPPKTLSIRLPTATDDSSQAPPRRAVSGKIKNLMGKMGDLKILSPTDTPPLWRKSEERTDSDYERTESRDSEDGSTMSAPSTKSPTIIPSKNHDNDVFPEPTKEPAPNSPFEDSGNSESAVSFDLPAQVDVLAVTASKSRARIQAKRRPQSRHARQSALRKSGMDFDTVDNSGIEALGSDPSDNVPSGIPDKIPTVMTAPVDLESSSMDRLGSKDNDTGKFSSEKTAETTSSLLPEDRSELSFSKGSSLSLNKNTLLSPSTDEEDLFDVPPDLPEDPPKEDTLFGRAPILSPIDRLLVTKNPRSKERNRDKNSNVSESQEPKNVGQNKDASDQTSKVEENPEDDKPTDPLRDDNHDPLKDPSQLFAFVTKTPSPEKGQNLLFKEDASLFSHLSKKSPEEVKSASKKPILDLFADDAGGDLFSETLSKSTEKSKRPTKHNSLFDDIDNSEDSTIDLFGAGSKSGREKMDKIDESIGAKSNETSGRASPSRSSIFAEDDDDLFGNLSDKKIAPEPDKQLDITGTRLFSASNNTTKDAINIPDIFGDHSSGEEDLFANRKPIGSGKSVGTSGSIFSSDHDGDEDNDDPDDIFGTKATRKSSKVDGFESRSSAKKTVTRDLKKTAETIVQDPLSMLQDD